MMLGPPSEASRPRCSHGVDLALGRFAANLSAGGPKVGRQLFDGSTQDIPGNVSCGRTEGGAGGERFLTAGGEVVEPRFASTEHEKERECLRNLERKGGN